MSITRTVETNCANYSPSGDSSLPIREYEDVLCVKVIFTVFVTLLGNVRGSLAPFFYLYGLDLQIELESLLRGPGCFIVTPLFSIDNTFVYVFSRGLLDVYQGT